MATIGEMKHRVYLQAKNETRDAEGGVVSTWANIAEMWASINPVSGRETKLADQVVSLATHVIQIRWQKQFGFLDLTPMRFVSQQGIVYNIESTTEQYLEHHLIVCRTIKSIQAPLGSWSGFSGQWGGDTHGQSGFSGFSGSSVAAIGFSGVSGFSGWSGLSITGPVGPAGVQGLTGIQGLAGAVGSQGLTGLTGLTGLIGTTGIQGLAGGAGAQGNTGLQGLAGLIGSTGIQGVTGLAGIQGLQGATGIAGITGIFGLTGIQGVPGSAGSQGLTGLQGLTGIVGTQGQTGIQGITGLWGVTGSQGVTGFQGITGAVGTSGFSGYSGALGGTGPQGASGTSGQSGMSGTSGTSGWSGYSGPNGASGASGTSGKSGTSGWSGISGNSGYSGSAGTSTNLATASTIMARDVNANTQINSIIQNYTTTTTAAGTTTLTVGSSPLQFFTGTTTQTVVLPVVSTLALGQQYQINNKSTGVVTVQSSGANTVLTLNGGSFAILTCILITGTSAASWSANSNAPGAPLLVQTTVLNANTTLTSSAANTIQMFANSVQRICTLPQASTMPIGTQIWLESTTAVGVDIRTDGTTPDSIDGTACNTLGPKTQKAYSRYGVMVTSTSSWITIGTNADAIEANLNTLGAVTLTNATAANVITLSLSNGEWDVTGGVNFSCSSATTTQFSAGITLTTTTIPSDGTEKYRYVPATTATFTDSITLGTKRIVCANTSSFTSLYLVCSASFSAGTVIGYGSLVARRIR